ncbi:MAG: pilus assembly PilX N-terminal domain-containing protein [Patescibacteria group bacterium]
MINPRNNRGEALIYSLLVIGLITAIALTVSMVIINELRLTSSSSDGVLAYYAAESGIERGLYGLKVNRDAGVRTLRETVDLIVAYAENFSSNNANYENKQTFSETSLIHDRAVAENEFVQADFFDVDNPLDPQTSPPSENRLINQVFVQNIGGDENTWAEVSWIGWNSDGLLETSVTAKKILGHTDLTNGWTINLSQAYSDPSSIVGYRLRIRALFGPLPSLSVTPLYEGAEITNLPSQVIVKSVGKRNSFKQALTATVPWRLPLAGLYDYVLFSEGELTKDIILSKSVYSSGVIQAESSRISSCADCATCTPIWQAIFASCSNASCTVGPSLSYCTASTIGVTQGAYTLPIPAYVSAADELYVSMRMRGTTTLADMVTIDDPANGQVGFTFSSTSDTTWQTCTIPESFGLGSVTAGRTITFTNQNTANGSSLDVDWYQISSYKIFNDCPTS